MTPAPSFAERQLKKYGWEAGQALGTNGSGLKKAISLGVKDNTDGLGAKAGEWGFAWWDHVFNKTSAGIQIGANSDGDVKITKASETQQREKEKSLLYGSFVKSSSSGGDAALEKDDKDKDYSIKVSDKDLLLACEGRTARKGARSHQPGKLARTHHDTMDAIAISAASDQQHDKLYTAESGAPNDTMSIDPLYPEIGLVDGSEKSKLAKKEKKDSKKNKKDKTEKKDKEDKTEKKERKDKTEKKDKQDKTEKKERKDKKDKQDKTEKKDKKAKRSPSWQQCLIPHQNIHPCQSQHQKNGHGQTMNLTR
ncbi:hypothetical protein BASA60_009826 [Batrachochytrium salamandrivorans]|nr:hypothetical protein BASA60_009826 [Batrachochytrium salamandrivorans]